MCLTLSKVLNLKHILSNEAVIDDVLEDLSHGWQHPNVMVKHCGQLFLLISVTLK